MIEPTVAAQPPETIGALLAQVRGELGLTQLRLAERLCAASGQATLTRNEISRWERCERIPSRYWLDWLAVVLDMPVTRLERASAAARRRRRGAPESDPRADRAGPPDPGLLAAS
jgi:transcriptional regulator with XRE-family HTH domain